MNTAYCTTAHVTAQISLPTELVLCEHCPGQRQNHPSTHETVGLIVRRSYAPQEIKSSQHHVPSTSCAQTPRCLYKCLLVNLVKTGIKSTCFLAHLLVICLFAWMEVSLFTWINPPFTASCQPVWCLHSCSLTASCFYCICDIVSFCMSFCSQSQHLSCLFFSSSVVHQCCVLVIFIYWGGIVRVFCAPAL